ncbi:MAG: phosphoserine phosphatase SerB [Xanthomonadaceae bacterium]|nr:phosphoserine phosphatase SerB [Xanthomonadaceae bacterium]
MMVLFTLSGPDRPGITHAISCLIALFPKTVIQNVGQSALGGWLSLTFSIETPDDEWKELEKQLLTISKNLGLHAEIIDQADNKSLKPSSRYAITLLGNPIKATALAAVTGLLVRNKINIDSLTRLSHSSLKSLELRVSRQQPLNIESLKSEILHLSGEHGIDIAVQNDGLFRRSKRLVVFDMDSTLITNEIIDEFARKMNCMKDVGEITERAMRGDLDFNSALKLRVSKLKGLTQAEINEVYSGITLTPGAAELIQMLKLLGLKTAILSGGFDCVVNRFKDKLGVDVAYSNSLEMKNGVATGEVIPPIVNAERKAQLLVMIALQEGISLEQVVAVGDGANDLPMLQKAGLGIAFNAKPKVREKADLAINQQDMRNILYLLGISEKDWLKQPTDIRST